MSSKRPVFSQIVIGPPGSGKTTYCYTMANFLTQNLKRKAVVVNLDPANDFLPYPCSISISNLVTVEEVMKEHGLGPNGGLLYCLEYLDQNFDWLEEKLKELDPSVYVIFDCPGQVECYTHHSAIKNIVHSLSKLDFRLVSVNLIDSHYCSDPGKFISILSSCLATMVHIELPHVNLLSKVDLIERFGKIPFNVDFFTEVLDLQRLVDLVSDDPFFEKYRKLSQELAGIVEDYSLVSFLLLDIQNPETLLRISKIIDKANGYIIGSLDEKNIESILSFANSSEYEYERIQSVYENYLNNT